MAKKKRYATVLTDKERALIQPFTGRLDPRGAVRRHAMRTIINAILYAAKTGCRWHMLPKDFPPYQTVFDHFSRMGKRGVWEDITLALNELSRKKTGAKPRRHTSLLTRRA